MNPEIRFRVPDDVYALAAERAERLLGDSARNVSNLARGALYRALGLPTEVVVEPPPLQPDQIVVSVRHAVQDEYRKQQALTVGQAVPATVTTDLHYAPGQLPKAFLNNVELEADGRATVRLSLESLASQRERATEAEVLQALKDKNRTARALENWAQQHGSPLLRARREENFDWERLARLEFARTLLSAAGLTGFKHYDDVRPFREPSLESIEKLRAARAQVKGATLSLVLVTESRRGDFSGLQASITAPDGVVISLVRRLEATPQGTRMQTLAP